MAGWVATTAARTAASERQRLTLGGSATARLILAPVRRAPPPEPVTVVCVRLDARVRYRRFADRLEILSAARDAGRSEAGADRTASCFSHRDCRPARRDGLEN